METVLAEIGLFVLRLGVPVVVLALLAWAVNWYARREKMRALEAQKRAAEQMAAAPATQNGKEEQLPVR